MKLKMALIGLLVGIGIATAQPLAWFVQDFESFAPGRYKTLIYTADGVDVTMSGVHGPFTIGDGMLSPGGGKSATVLFAFSDTIHGITADLFSECGRLSSVAVLSCFDVSGNRLFTLTNKGRPCNQLTRTGASILGERIIASCEASGGLFDNIIVEP